MSPTSEHVERLAREHGVPVLSVLEFYLERAAIREFEGCQGREDAESGALGDVDMWIKLHKQLNKGSK
jgi:hypothetical protein